MKEVLNHTEEDLRATSVRSGGIGIVKKDMLPAYRQNLREKSNISEINYDPMFKAKMRPIDNII